MSLNLMASRPSVRSRGGHDGDGDRGLYPQYFCCRRGLRSRQRLPVVLVFQVNNAVDISQQALHHCRLVVCKGFRIRSCMYG
ncbi:hypothetical protein OPV22_023975 [Ensete ventricosum]|uniref:Uncharacterized protein n=1 Tax=Ensete ventricosum TaxID=4639 RepID=A0AAV8QT85_ENSVE|nr:hypothetical protein OPV22_023975 [Ensete ventricosum]